MPHGSESARWRRCWCWRRRSWMVYFASKVPWIFPRSRSRDCARSAASDEPTDLSLRLDYRLQHILVDEFQDTSSSQLELVRLLTAGWQPGDGRSIFCVGDPMQSIYGFRQAEVRAFLELAEEGHWRGALRSAASAQQFSFGGAVGGVGQSLLRTSHAADRRPQSRRHCLSRQRGCGVDGGGRRMRRPVSRIREPQAPNRMPSPG